ncbi:MAG: hypothetical protein Q8R20_00490 [Nanoarchaeota archaeon]|nr:hypothetical protein [Nanoarchaeota archaeon]
MKKITGILIVIAIVGVLVILWTRKAETPKEPSPEGEEPVISEEATPENTTPKVVGEELEGVDLGDLQKELQGIDSELEGLK